MRIRAWLLDLYPTPEGMVLWVIDAEQRRTRLVDADYVPAFYVAGPRAALRRLGVQLAARFPVRLAWVERREFWSGEARQVLEVGVRRLAQFDTVVRWTHERAPALELFNCDIQLPALYAYEKRVFPLARCVFEIDEANRLRALEVEDDPWATEYALPPLAVMQLRLEGELVNPHHGHVGELEVRIDGRVEALVGENPRELLRTFAHLLWQYDPDLLLTNWGDSFLLPRLIEAAERYRVPLPLNRDPACVARHKRARSYFSYGRIVFKDSTTTLYGRLHVDRKNSFVVGETDLEGLFELSRLSKLPLQYMARTSTGTGITSMQLDLAFRQGILIPWQKREPEEFKTADQLLLTDRGGLVFKPVLGLHKNVGELDFASMFPAIMARFNVSPETVNCRCGCGERVPEIGYRLCRRRQGIVPQTVGPIIEKRWCYKQLKRAAAEAGDSALRERYDQRQSSLKWLLVTCFGYLGYKNARFGRIEAHEAINAFGREKLLVAKELAERSGFRLLHAIVDSLWVVKPGATRADYERLTREVAAATDLPVDLAGVYKFIVFLPSRENPAVPVPNRYFGVFAGTNELKVRGLEVRRHDSPPIVARMQEEVLKILSEADDADSYRRKLAEAEEVFGRYQQRLLDGKVSWEELIIRKRLTRHPRDYQRASHVAVAAQSLAARGVKLRPGEVIEYVITAADSAVPCDRARPFTLLSNFTGYDRKKYLELLEKAFDPFRFGAPPMLGNLILAAECAPSARAPRRGGPAHQTACGTSAQ
ncbi:MAG TPA: DNA polymerase domain-containing protein [Candidatus Xenobia bacterium]|nr:DNA polymerase domain-containing protein [Candidatus Xenobia bacterium]